MSDSDRVETFSHRAVRNERHRRRIIMDRLSNDDLVDWENERRKWDTENEDYGSGRIRREMNVSLSQS